MALFELTELASLLQRDIDTATATLARDLATGLVVDVTGVLEQATVTVTLPIDADEGLIHLPSRVVTAVSTVEISGTALAGSGWVWEKPYPRVRLLTCTWLSNTTAAIWPTADVTATLGYATGKVPKVAKAVAMSVASRIYDNPTGLRAEQIDDYSATRAGADDDLAGITLTAAELNALERLAPTAYVTRAGR